MSRSPRNRLASYRSVQVNTASPGQKVVMVYDAIIRCLREGLDALAENTPESIARVDTAMQQAERFILELQLALDQNQGGAIATNLDRLYGFWIRHLSDANANKRPEPVQDVLNMVSELRLAWEQAATEARKLGVG